MPGAETDLQPSASATPHGDLAAFLIERNYEDMGCSTWNTRRVQLLCAQLGDTPRTMAARLRLRPTDMERRMESDAWTKQDGLILTLLQQAVDLLKGGVVPKLGILPQQ